MFNKLFTAIKKYKKDNPKEFWLLVIILVVGAFLRLYRIPEYMTFLGDEGRDVIIVRRLITELDLILVGPGTSIGNMYLGPLYYYMMAPALALAGLSPVGPAIQIALLGVLTIWFVWFVANQWFGKTAAFVAAFLYTISPTVIHYARSSWNPNIMPFFALLLIWSVWKFWIEKQWKWLIVTGVSMAFIMQSHYLGLILFPLIGLFWLLSYRGVVNKVKEKRLVIRYSLFSGAIFTALMSPLVIFDARHGWRNFAAIKKFFLERQTTVSARPWTSLPKLWPNFVQINTSLLAANQEKVGLYVSAAFVVLIIWLLRTQWSKFSSKTRSAYYLLIVWIGLALVGFGIYKQHIYDHYYGFIFPALFIFLGGLLQYTLEKADKAGKNILLAGLALLVFVNLQNNALLFEPNRQYPRSLAVAEKIKEEAKGNPFNLAVIAERNYEDGYQYHLERWKLDVRDIDSQLLDETVTDQLFVICELVDREKCDPVHSPKAEVVNFGWTRTSEEWEVGGTMLYKLVHVERK